MARPENVMQVFSLLDKSNCRRCGEKTCLAFAGAVYQGRRRITECPTLRPEDAARFGETADSAENGADDEQIAALKRQLGSLDLADAARRTGGRVTGDRLVVKVLGKDFGVDRHGAFFSELHQIPWLTGPFLTYACDGQGRALTGEWVSYRELRDGKERYPLFEKRCEQGMQRIADCYTDLFDDMVRLFQGKEIDSPFDSDICVVLRVLPLVPLMICYWKPDEGMASTLNVFFDRSAEDNLGCDAAFTIGAGLTQMFEKLAHRHGCVTMSG